MRLLAVLAEECRKARWLQPPLRGGWSHRAGTRADRRSDSYLLGVAGGEKVARQQVEKQWRLARFSVCAAVERVSLLPSLFGPNRLSLPASPLMMSVPVPPFR